MPSLQLTHSYVDLCQPTETRRQTLQARYGFQCECVRCTAGLRTEAGEDVDALLRATAESYSDGCHSAGGTSSGGGGEHGTATLLHKSAMLLQAANQEEDETREFELLREALSIRRAVCHPLSTATYEVRPSLPPAPPPTSAAAPAGHVPLLSSAPILLCSRERVRPCSERVMWQAECQALTCALAVGRLDEALASCRVAVRFLEMALSHVPHHPLLALQRFTLSDLELACAEHQAEAAQPAQAAEARESGGAAATGRAAALDVMIECAAAIEVSSATGSALRETARTRLADLRALVPDRDTAGVQPVLC